MASAETADRPGGEPGLAAPSISVPKGGGVIRGVGEKCAANPVRGTGELSGPLTTSRSRPGFPRVFLFCNSGWGNRWFDSKGGIFPSGITRKTDKGLEQYRHADECDLYMLYRAEDLVRVVQAESTRYGADDLLVHDSVGDR
jgi:hypothetical protein